MEYLAVLGRIPEISKAELASLFGEVKEIAPGLATFKAETEPEIDRLGGSMKLARKLSGPLVEYLLTLPEGKITIGVSDYSPRGSARKSSAEAMKLKKILTRHGRSVRILQNKSAALSTATVLHNGLGRKPCKLEIILVGSEKYIGIGVQDIDAYARRDQVRPARDAKVGMLPPKLAQILINLCGPLPTGARVLDPFCGTGVVMQEAYLMGYEPYGTDLSERMVEYTRKNMKWLGAEKYKAEEGDATSYQWEQPIDAVACETYLGPPMSQPPVEIKLKDAKQQCREIILSFLKNLAGQIKSGTPVVIAVPAWLRPNGEYSRLNILDLLPEMGYNVNNTLGSFGLLYYREGQVVAREIIVLRKK